MPEYFSEVHAHEDPPVTDAASVYGPRVKHHQLKANPAEVASRVLDAFFICRAVYADNELRTFEAIAACQLEKSHETVAVSVLATVGQDACTNPGFRSFPMTSLSKKTNMARSSSFSATNPLNRVPPA